VVNSTTQSPAGHQAPQPLQLQMHSLIDVSTKRPMLQNRRPLSCGTAARPFLHKLQKPPLLIDNLQHSTSNYFSRDLRLLPKAAQFVSTRFFLMRLWHSILLIVFPFQKPFASLLFFFLLLIV
jgi:hypothetical protein